MNFIRTSLLGLLALPLAAQSTGISAGASLIYAPKDYFGSYYKVLHNDCLFGGAGVNVAYDMNLYKTDVASRVTLGYNYMNGQYNDYGFRTSLQSIQLAGDLFLDIPDSSLRGVVGLSLNSYFMDCSSKNTFPSGNDSTGEDYTPGNANYHYPIRECKGLKFGFRVGLEYAFDKTWSAEVLLQQTELSGKSNDDPLTRLGGINPAWLQLGVRYHF